MGDYIPPDYSEEHIIELEEDSEDDIRLEKLLDEQEELNKQLERALAEDDDEEEFYEERRTPMSSSPFGSSPSPARAPWENNTSPSSPWAPKPTTPTWGGGGWTGGGSSWGSSTEKKDEPAKLTGNIGQDVRKRVVICDVLDCLYESWESQGKPNILPRGIFDLKPKFDVWDKIGSFAPRRIYIIFPPNELIPSFGNIESSAITLEYVAHSLSTYLRIPRSECKVLHQKRLGTPKERVLLGAIHDWKKKEEMVYVGVHTGRWGLSAADIEASHGCGIDYIDVYNLLAGKYEYE